MGKIRISHIIAPIDYYGKERWVISFLKYLDRKRFESRIIIISTSNETFFSEKLESLKISCKFLNGKGKINVSDIKKLRNYIIGDSCDILHSHDYKSDIFSYWASRGLPVKKISTPHGWCGKGDLKIALYEKIDKIFLKFFDKVVLLSKNMASSLREIPSNRLAVINNFIDLDRIPKPEVGYSNLITFMGRLVELKRVQDAIRAINLVKNKNIRLQIIGDGPLRGKLELLSQKLGLTGRVEFLGHKENSLELLNRSKIFILTSLTEGISRSVMEAMALKRIIISTNIPGINELIRHGENGFLVETKNPEALAKMIDYVMDNMSSALTIADRARETVEKKHSAAKVVRDYEKLYRSLID